MAPYGLLIPICITALTITALVLGSVAWARVTEFSLPLPTALPALNVAIPVLVAVGWTLSRRSADQIRKQTLRFVLRYIAQASTLAPFALLVLSLVYGLPSDLQYCAADQQWLRMFENKDARAVRGIQSRLQCCGYHSMHDRAWPFPSRDVDVRTCERTQGYTVACGRLWQNEEQFAAILTAVASVCNMLMMILTIATFGNDEGRIRLPAWSAQPTRLIEDSGIDNEAEPHNVEIVEDDPEGRDAWRTEGERQV